MIHPARSFGTSRKRWGLEQDRGANEGCHSLHTVFLLRDSTGIGYTDEQVKAVEDMVVTNRYPS